MKRFMETTVLNCIGGGEGWYTDSQPRLQLVQVDLPGGSESILFFGE